MWSSGWSPLEIFLSVPLVDHYPVWNSKPQYFLDNLLAPSGALVVIMVYYISAAPTFSDFSNSSDSKVKVKVKGPNMCYIFLKAGGYRIWPSHVPRPCLPYPDRGPFYPNLVLLEVCRSVEKTEGAKQWLQWELWHSYHACFFSAHILGSKLQAKAISIPWTQLRPTFIL